MKIVFFEDLLEEQVGSIPEITINANVSRKPSFGWGDSNALRKFLAKYKEKHNPLIWSVPGKSTSSGESGILSRSVTLNLCAVETNVDLLNSVRMNPDRSFKKVLVPLWEQLGRRFQLSDISVVEDTVSFQPFPDYKVGTGDAAASEGQFIWDVLRVTFDAHYSDEYSPCNNY